MKKILLVALLAVMFFAPSAKAFKSCEDGVVIVRNRYTDEKAPEGCNQKSCPGDEKKFCMSNEKMTWREASKWCNARGGSLVYFSRVCPSIRERANNVKGACPALQGIHETTDWVWTSFRSDRTNALTVVISTGGLIDFPQNHIGLALCE